MAVIEACSGHFRNNCDFVFKSNSRIYCSPKKTRSSHFFNVFVLPVQLIALRLKDIQFGPLHNQEHGLLVKERSVILVHFYGNKPLH